MMGVTHGLAGLACAACVAGGAQLLGAPLDPAATLAVIAAATLAAEAPDLDLACSRISRGSSTLTGARVLRPFALVLTLPLVLAGVAVRCLGARHRGPTHSLAAAVLSAPLVLALYIAYLHLMHALAGVADEHRLAHVTFHLQDLTARLLDGWPAVLPAAGVAWGIAYAGHLMLDDLTAAPQALLWPFKAKPITVFRWPRIRVGSITELTLVAAPLGAVAIAVLLHVSHPQITLPAFDDLRLDR